METIHLRALETVRAAPHAVAALLRSAGAAPIDAPAPIANLARRPEVPFGDLLAAAGAAGVPALRPLLADGPLRAQVAAEVRYAGYVRRERQLIERQARHEALPIPAAFDYAAVRSLSAEAAETLARIRPASFGQASRVAGVTPADLNVLRVALHR